MLMTTELVRDVLCHELIQVMKYRHDVNELVHLKNMHDILMSDTDFVHVDAEVWTSDLPELQKELDVIVKSFAARKEVQHGQR